VIDQPILEMGSSFYADNDLSDDLRRNSSVGNTRMVVQVQVLVGGVGDVYVAVKKTETTLRRLLNLMAGQGGVWSIFTTIWGVIFTIKFPESHILTFRCAAKPAEHDTDAA